MRSVELFAGAGGLAIAMSNAGFRREHEPAHKYPRFWQAGKRTVGVPVPETPMNENNLR